MTDQEKKMLLNTQVRLLELEKRVRELEDIFSITYGTPIQLPRIGRDENWPLNLEIEETK